MELNNEDQRKPITTEDDTSNTRNIDSKPRRVHLYTSILILNIIYLSVGTAFAWSSPVLLKLNLTAEEGSTVASVMPLGGMMGPFVAGLVLDRLGRKYTAALNMGLMTGSFLLLTVSRNVTVLTVGRFMAGLSWGFTFTSLPMYIAEISEDSVRGILNTMNMIFIASGSILMYGVGPFISYELLHYILLGICGLFFLLFPILPNSPHVLVMKGQINDARDTLTWLREKRSPSYIEKELQTIQKAITESQAESTGSIKDLFISRGNRRAFTICCVLVTLQQVSGITIVLFYMQQIFHITGSNIPSSTCSIIVGVIKLTAGFICPMAVKSFGYKTPLIASFFGSALGVGGLGVFFFLKFRGYDVSYLNWLPLSSVVVYVLCLVSAFSIPWALSGELFPSNIKPVATSLIAGTSAFGSFMTAKMFPYLTKLFGLDFLFMGFSLCCFLGIVFIVMSVQDTSGMSFVEIQDMLNGHKKKDILLVQKK